MSQSEEMCVVDMETSPQREREREREGEIVFSEVILLENKS